MDARRVVRRVRFAVVVVLAAVAGVAGAYGMLYVGWYQPWMPAVVNSCMAWPYCSYADRIGSGSRRLAERVETW